MGVCGGGGGPGISNLKPQLENTVNYTSIQNLISEECSGVMMPYVQLIITHRTFRGGGGGCGEASLGVGNPMVPPL